MNIKTNTVKQIIPILRKQTKHFNPTLIETIIREYGKHPFLILVSCLLSLRSKDLVTVHVCRNLFKKARTPQEILSINKTELEKLIYKTGFYKQKAKVIHEVSHIINKKYNDQVPSNKQELLAITGIGPKTANLVLGMAFDIPTICVDTHVHRISNLLGIIKTKTPEQTEIALEKVLPKKHFIEWNDLLVLWGQNICIPLWPRCSQCAIKHLCIYNKK